MVFIRLIMDELLKFSLNDFLACLKCRICDEFNLDKSKSWYIRFIILPNSWIAQFISNFKFFHLNSRFTIESFTWDATLVLTVSNSISIRSLAERIAAKTPHTLLINRWFGISFRSASNTRSIEIRSAYGYDGVRCYVHCLRTFSASVTKKWIALHLESFKIYSWVII